MEMDFYYVWMSGDKVIQTDADGKQVIERGSDRIIVDRNEKILDWQFSIKS